MSNNGVSTGPRVTLKIAQTLDGRVATRTGDSRWITGDEARAEAHRLRAENDAVLVGIGTVVADDPELTVRHVEGKNPLRVILDSRLSIRRNAKVLRTEEAATVIATIASSDSARRRLIERSGATILVAGDEDGHVSLSDLLSQLATMGVSRLLVEGGPTVATEFLKQRLVDHVVALIAPAILGAGIDAVQDLGATRVAERIRLEVESIETLGVDLVLRAEVLH
ncbi:MAG TPA: 5-amino-6-(5-phosphoribosylamino)uracil reductase [Chloroflexi bacterium]|jgi:riboflavin-specific deaminase-like protein|nr:5-amino-6-(5-phosphoribosylamino)uracil reductase [Chloroflexota bacterium]